MTGDLRGEIRRIFFEASELPAEQRAAYLDRACAGDAEMRAKVESLLTNLDRAGDFMSAPTAAHEPALTPPPTPETIARSDVDRADDATRITAPQESTGSKIGKYKLLQKIGEGGFGTVFMAEQEEPIRRRVALKIIKPGMDTGQVVARFEAERQALALMDHPNIARVFDGGATAAGRPYFVMELVPGEPITNYCDRNNLSIPERLDLFAQVCTAVQHAHTKGIIHRDIKPSNVLVSTQDDKPLAKVIDFGIAKATDARLTEKTFFTEHRQMIGTPAYMSPEQAAGSLDIDTRSDVYSLGVLLYELLTGTTPFDSKRLRSAAFEEMRRIICEDEPPKPSTRLSQTTDTLPSVAAQRRTEPRRLSAIIRGELDWIVMKALEKDRQRRYDSANGLAADVRRYLSGEPVVAAPPSRGYRFRKFVRRNRRAVITSGAVAASLLIAGGAIVVGVIREAEAKAETAIAKEREANARAEAGIANERADTFGTFLDATLGLANPPELQRRATERRELIYVDTVNDVSISEAMLHGLEVISAGIPGISRERQAYILNAIAQYLTRLDKGEAALRAAEQVVSLRRQMSPGDSRELATSLNVLATAKQNAGRLDEAEHDFSESLAICRRLFSGDHPDIVENLSDIALIQNWQRRYKAAEPRFIEALAMYQRLYPGDHPDVATAMKNLAVLLAETNREVQAEPLYVKSLEMRQRLYPGGHPSVANALMNLADVHVRLAQLSAAEKEARDAYAMCKKHADWRSGLLEEATRVLLDVLKKTGKLDQAIQIILQSLPPPPQLDMVSRITPLETAAEHLLALESARAAKAAVPLLRESMDIHRNAFPAGHDFAWTTYNTMSLLGEALLAAADAWPIEPQSQPATSPARPPASRAATADVRAAFAEAEPLLLRAWEQLSSDPKASTTDGDVDYRRDALQRLASCYEAWQQFDPSPDHERRAKEWGDRLSKYRAARATQPATSTAPK